MQLKNHTHYAIAAAVVLVTLVTPAAAPACDRLWVAARELWAADGQQARLILSDVRGVLHPRWSPEGDRIAYGHDFRFENGPQSEVIVTGESGQTLATLAIPRDGAVNAIMQVGWRNERRVYAEGHVNPSTTKYYEWDVTNGRLVDEKTGSWFAVSPDGRFVAQRAHVPHGAPPPHDSAALLINDKRSYPPEGDRGYHRFAGVLAWSPDSDRVALLDWQDETAAVVIVSPGRGAVARAPVAASASPTELLWSGPNTVLIRSGDDAWRVDAATGKTEKVVGLPVASESVTPPASLRERVRGEALRIEDARCRP